MLNDTNRCGAARLEKKLFSGVRDAAAGSLPRDDGVILKHTFVFAASTPKPCPHKVRAARTHRRGCATALGRQTGGRGCAARPRSWLAPHWVVGTSMWSKEIPSAQQMCLAVHLKPLGALGRHP